MKTIDYPLKFTPILKQKIWGGAKLINILDKPSSSNQIGESWEIADVNESISIISNGTEAGKTIREAISIYKEHLVGHSVYKQFGNQFPLLLKFIDAKQDLSVQTHPNDEFAKQRHGSSGKTEMWYVLQADEASKLQLGFKNAITKQKFHQAVEENQLIDLLHFQSVQAGDVFFIPPGFIHAIGGGVMLAEIQQSSDITYRIYDWGRLEQGKPRELHIELALDVLDFSASNEYEISYVKAVNQSINLVTCPYFTTNILVVDQPVDKQYSEIDSFVILMCVQGEATITCQSHNEYIQRGETILIPASVTTISIYSEYVEFLEIYLE